MLAGIIVVGTSGYVALGWDFLDALYMTVITVGTIGFEEVRDLDESVAGRLWTIVLIISGVAVLGYATTSLVALAVEGTVRDYFRSRRMRARISKLHGHHILCGYGRVGRQVAAEFALEDVPFVVVEQDPRTVEECLSQGYLALFSEPPTTTCSGRPASSGPVGSWPPWTPTRTTFSSCSRPQAQPGVAHRGADFVGSAGGEARDSGRRPDDLALRRRWQ